MDDIKPEVIKIGGQDYIGEAKSISSSSTVRFKLWADENHELFIQLIGSSGGGNANTSMLFSASDNLGLCKNWNGVTSLKGFDRDKKVFTETTGENNILFLAAVLKYLLPEQSSISASDIKIGK